MNEKPVQKIEFTPEEITASLHEFWKTTIERQMRSYVKIMKEDKKFKAEVKAVVADARRRAGK